MKKLSLLTLLLSGVILAQSEPIARSSSATLVGATLTLSGSSTTNLLLLTDTTNSKTLKLRNNNDVWEFYNTAGTLVGKISATGSYTATNALVGTQISLSSTTSTGLISGSLSAASATSSSPAVKIRATATLDADDLVLGIEQSTNPIWSIDKEGDTVAKGRSANTVQAITVADNAGGTNAADTLTPSSSFVSYTCSDANGCDITLSETGAIDGSIVRITNVSAVACNFADTAGLTELAGAFAMGQYDSLTLIYATDRFVEISRSNN